MSCRLEAPGERARRRQMHAVTHPFLTTHGLRRLERERTSLRDWLKYLTFREKDSLAANQKQNREIALILSEERIVANRLKRVNTAYNRALALPKAWSNKIRARAGDTVYLQHKDIIRELTLTAVWNADPVHGKVSVTSPIGMSLVGRKPGDKVRIPTLDGDLEYYILKIM